MVKKTFLSKDNLQRHFFILSFYLTVLAAILYFPLILERFNQKTTSKELYISAFSDVITEELFRKFEEQTGIKVHTKYCDSDSEMWAQLYMNEGNGYDLVTPTDYMAEVMGQHNLISPIDAAKIENYAAIDESFLNSKLTDAEFPKTVPFAWSVHGLGFKKSFFDNKGLKRPNSFAYVFKPEKIFSKKALAGMLKRYRVCIIDDPQELVFISSIFLFGDASFFSPQRLQKIYEMLVQQRKWTLAYTTADVTYYLSHCAPVVLALAAHIKQSLETSSAYELTIPKEGSLLTVQQFCIPKTAKHRDFAYQFINFILSPECQAAIFDQTGFCPTNPEAKKLISPKFANHNAFFPDKMTMEKLHKITSLLPVKKSEELLYKVKAS
jgi:spermidine/putrescine-binding protein